MMLPVVRVALATGLVLLLPLVAMQFGDEVNWSAGDFVLAAILLMSTGALLELAARGPRRGGALRAVIIAVGIASVLLGNADDAPGLVLFGGLVILATVWTAIRAGRSGERPGRVAFPTTRGKADG